MFYAVFVSNDVNWLSWDFYVLCNSFPRHIDVFLLLSKFLKTANLCENLIWYLPLNSTLFNSFYLNLLRVSFTYWKSFPKFDSLQIVIRVTVRSSEWSDLKDTWTQSSIHMWSNCESPSLVIPIVFKNVSMSEYSVLNNTFLDVSNFSTLKLSLTLSCKLPFPTVCLQISSLLNFVLKPPNRISYGIYGNNWIPTQIPHTNCLLHHHLFGACLFRTIKSHLRFPSVMRDIISLTSCSASIADCFFLGTKSVLSKNDDYLSFSTEESTIFCWFHAIPASSDPLFFH
jgi:hypothetical protein